MRSQPLPFLRSPPFPGIKPGDAAVSTVGGDANGQKIDDALIEAITLARVGGTFWGRQVKGIKLVVGAGISPPASMTEGLARDEIGVLAARSAWTGGRVLPAACDPWTLAEEAEAICAAPDDEIALVAAMLGKAVHGADGALLDPVGLRAALARRLADAVYRDCHSGAAADAARVVAILADWRRTIDANKGLAAASGMAFWKRAVMRHFLWDGERSPPFLKAERGLAKAATKGGALAIWPSRVPPSTIMQAAAKGAPVARVEDGFLRSRGLGAALHPPGSVVVDRTGLYYDATRPSDLERLLATHEFSDALVERAARLRARICATGVSKYGAQGADLLTLPKGRRTVLAVGQVDDDLSVKLGGAGVGGNRDFLARVRQAEPDAWIVYRPHPDVQAGHRRGHMSRAEMLRHADAVDSGSALMPLVERVDAVHVLSSLTGFEALMRGRAVTVHGQPFYAGWGLTRDLAPPCPRRGRALDLDQLVAAALILYPRYLDPMTHLWCGPEEMIDRMASGATPPLTWLIRMRMMQGKLRRFMTVSAEFFRG
ncbi:MAG: beta-3-deoxy-D-manno-oct-2-ulosonic acid transferase [Sphingobium sp.]